MELNAKQYQTIKMAMRSALAEAEHRSKTSLDDTWQRRQADRDIDDITDVMLTLARDFQCKKDSLIGKVVRTSFEPYDAGTAKIVSIEDRGTDDGYFTMTVAAEDMYTTSRLMGQSSTKPTPRGTELTMPLSEWEIYRSALEDDPSFRYVYPV
jgi:hypothetical protein